MGYDQVQRYFFKELWRSFSYSSSHISLKDTNRSLPKFGEWDVTDPASAESFTVIFNKARDERKTGSSNQESNSPSKAVSDNQETAHTISKSHSSKWCCCLKSTAAES